MRFFLFSILIFVATTGYSSTHIISGYVKEEKTLMPIPYATILIKGTTKGIVSNDKGYFSLEANHSDSILISYLGYVNTDFVVVEDNEDMVILLEPEANVLNEVNILPEEDYAKLLFKRIIKNKKANIEQIESVSSLSNVNATTIYLAIDSGIQRSKLVGNLEGLTIHDEEHNVHFSPIFLSEEANEITHGKEKRIYTRKDGIFPKLNQSIETLITEYLVVNIDPYKNNIYIFDKTFVSPISNNARTHYNIYLNDSTYIKGEKYYNFTFTPKNQYAKLFTGRFSVDSKKYAIKDIDLYFQKQANINFVNGFKANIAYKANAEGKTYLNHQNLAINLSVFGNNNADKLYASDRVDKVSNGNWLLNKTSYYSPKKLDPVHAHLWRDDEDFGIDSINMLHYHMIEEIKKQPLVRAVDGIGGAAVTSYLKFKWIDLGPMYDIYSTNAIEDTRLSIPLRTNESVLEHLTIGGFISYGTRTEAFKFGGNIAWQPLISDKLVLRFMYDNDYTLISKDKFLRFIKKNPNSRGNGNFISTITSSVKDPYLKENKRFEFRLEYNADEHITAEISPYVTQNISTPAIQFINKGTNYAQYNNYGVFLNCRLAFNQSFDKEYFARIYYITSKPIFNISMDFGQINLPNSDENLGIYSQIHGSMTGMIGLGQMAMRYMINGGYLHGEAPYDLLDMPVGARSLGYAKYRYNLLYQASFAHNAYTNAHLELSGGGILLNHIPLIRRLKLREVVSLKGHYGVRNNGYKEVFTLPEAYENEMNYPYTELGIGLTNIFKIIRIEYVRQIGDYHLEDGIASKQGLRIRAEMSF